MKMSTNKRLKREQVDESQTWNLNDLFLTRNDWENELMSIKEDLPKVTKFKGKLNESSKVLVQALEARERLLQRLTRVNTYASLRQSVDSTSPENQGDAERAAALSSTAAAAVSFIETEITSTQPETLEEFFNTDIELRPFKKYINELHNQKPHILNGEAEEVLAALSSNFSAPYTIYSRTKLSDMQFEPFIDEKGEEKPNSFALYEGNYEAHPSPITRRNATTSFVNTLRQYKNTVASAYATKVNQEIVISRLRKFESVTDMLLQPQQVTREMYNNQLDVIQKELAPHMRRYAKLKQRVLKLDKMFFADLKAPLDPDYKIETTYEEACDIIIESLKVMGPEYTNMVKKALTEKWIDYSDNIGKSTGAFCSSPYGVHPYILMTWNNSMRDAFTLAHELGHAGHFYFAEKNQRMINTRPSLYFIEAPSTMNEMLLGRHLLKHTKDNRTKRWVILQQLGTYYHNFVTHILEGELQRRIYALAEDGWPITANLLSEQKSCILNDFWGDTVEIDEGASLTWMRQPHYYMGLYPYTYSAGLTISTAVSQTIFQEGQPAVNRWLDVLKSGGTLKPLDLIRKAGLDMSQPDAISNAVQHVGLLIDELEKSYND